MELATDIALGLTAFGLVAGCIRMLKGPTAADRIVALDLITILLVAVSSLLALQLENAAYLDLGLALALIGFLATVGFARYLEVSTHIPLDDADAAQKDETNAEPPSKEKL
jgi:multicomponent Na+:H+ antiporter subunit F